MPGGASRSGTSSRTQASAINGVDRSAKALSTAVLPGFRTTHRPYRAASVVPRRRERVGRGPVSEVEPGGDDGGAVGGRDAEPGRGGGEVGQGEPALAVG